MLKHMLTQSNAHGVATAFSPPPLPSQPPPPLAAKPNFKLATRANQQSSGQMLDAAVHADANLDEVMTPTSPRPTAMNSSIHGNLTLNQSIYANTVTLPKMNGTAVRHGSNGSSGSNKSNGLNTSKLSSSNSPATTNQTKTSYMDSSRDHSHHELENTQLSPITGRASRPNLLSHSPIHQSNLSRSFSQANAANRSQINSTMLNGGGAKKLSTSLLPANVSKFMLLSKEAGVRVAITSLGLLCLVSLLLALLSFFFLLKISPTSSGGSQQNNYQFDFLSPSEFDSLYEVTLALCALTLVLNLCCLVVCAIQFLFAVKLVKSPHGRQRTTKYLKGAASTRVCAIGGFFVSIPLFLTGVVLYTFLHFDSTPAIVSSVVIGLGIVFCAAAVVHNVFIWQKEKTANVTKSASNSPVLARNQNGIQLDATSKTATIGGLPQATLDLSGHNSRVLELSTLV